MPFLGLFLLKTKSFSNTQVVQFFALYSFSVALLEIPTGVFADKINEKYSLIIGNLFRCLSVVLLLTGDFIVVMLSQIVLSIGDAFNSGCDQGLLYHYCQENEEQLKKAGTSYNNIISNVGSLMWTGVALAALAGYFLSLGNISYPFVITAALYATCVLIVLSLPQSNHHREKKSRDILLKSFDLLRENIDVRYWVLFGMSTSSFIVITYLLLQPFLNEIQIAGPRNGILYFCITLFAVLGGIIYKKISNVQKKVIIPWYVILLLIVIVLALAYSSNYYVILLVFCLLRFVWGTSGPFFMSNLNNAIPDNTIRNTVLSLYSLFGSLFTSSFLYCLSISGMRIAQQYLALAAIIIFVSSYFLFNKRLLKNLTN